MLDFQRSNHVFTHHEFASIVNATKALPSPPAVVCCILRLPALHLISAEEMLEAGEYTLFRDLPGVIMNATNAANYLECLQKCAELNGRLHCVPFSIEDVFKWI